MSIEAILLALVAGALGGWVGGKFMQRATRGSVVTGTIVGTAAAWLLPALGISFFNLFESAVASALLDSFIPATAVTSIFHLLAPPFSSAGETDKSTVQRAPVIRPAPSAPTPSKPAPEPGEPNATQPKPAAVLSAASRDKVFISYRRDDSLDTTGRIYDRLIREFGAEHVFRDLDNLPFGVDFREHIDRRLSDCDICIAVIGARWLNVTDKDGRRRIDDPRDHVRIEIETALRRNIRVVPLLVGNATIPAEQDLPPSLQPLAYRAGTHIRPDPDFHRDVDRLMAGLKAV